MGLFLNPRNLRNILKKKLKIRKLKYMKKIYKKIKLLSFVPCPKEDNIHKIYCSIESSLTFLNTISVIRLHSFAYL